MGMAIVHSLAAGMMVSLLSLSGCFVLWVRPDRLRRIVPYLVALAVGVLLGDAFLHLIPDAVVRQGLIGDIGLATMGGLFVFFVWEKGVRWRYGHDPDSAAGTIKPLARMNLIGDAVHNFVDGVLIVGSFIADPWLGMTTTAAILVHELPQEIGDVGALIHGGYAPRQGNPLEFRLFPDGAGRCLVHAAAGPMGRG